MIANITKPSPLQQRLNQLGLTDSRTIYSRGDDSKCACNWCSQGKRNKVTAHLKQGFEWQQYKLCGFCASALKPFIPQIEVALREGFVNEALQDHQTAIDERIKEEIVKACKEGTLNTAEIEKRFDIPSSQSFKLLNQLADEGKLIKQKRPGRSSLWHYAGDKVGVA